MGTDLFTLLVVPLGVYQSVQDHASLEPGGGEYLGLFVGSCCRDSGPNCG